MAALKATETEDNPKTAFALEPRDFFVAPRAGVEGYDDPADIRRAAVEDKVHARGRLKYLEESGDTEADSPIAWIGKNCWAAVDGKTHELIDMHLRTAVDERFDEAGDWLRMDGAPGSRGFESLRSSARRIALDAQEILEERSDASTLKFNSLSAQAKKTRYVRLVEKHPPRAGMLRRRRWTV